MVIDMWGEVWEVVTLRGVNEVGFLGSFGIRDCGEIWKFLNHAKRMEKFL